MGMKMLAALLICVSTPAMAFPGATNQPCDNPPPATAMAAPTVPEVIRFVPGAQMNAVCRKAASVHLYGCTFLPTAAHAAAFIFINADETPAERLCTLTYERAHLPPNNWLDPVVEAHATNAH